MYWKCGNNILEMGEKTYIMGILNVTPDSFSDGGLYNEPRKALDHAIQMIKDGADILDIGAQSTKPNHIEISPEEEWERLEPVLKLLKGNINVPISIDTYYPYVAKKAIEMGASIINDVSGVFNYEMAEIIKNTGVGWVIMHTGGGTADIVVDSENIISDVRLFFIDSLQKALEFDLNITQICFDMGIGFGKTQEQNLTLLKYVGKLKIDGIPILTGASRKRVIGSATNIENPVDRTYGNISAHCAAIFGGTDVIRVHDVYQEKKAAMMADAIFRGIN